MKRAMLAFTAVLLLAAPAMGWAMPMESGVPISLSSPGALLMEAQTGRVIFEKDADARRPVASVTKVMTILLTLEALEDGRIGAGDEVVVSGRAQSMGGSQAFLEAGGRYEVSELLKSVIIASANDSAVALAEYIAGAEEVFVRRMNERAAELGLTNTHFVNCTGLPAQGHYMSARDVAALSRELDRHPLYYEFSTVWMDEIAHPKGRKTQLTNTNRLIRLYPGCDGYKTGSTNEARYCMAATAKKDGMRLIAVVLGAESGQTRFNEARAMLEYGFAGYALYTPVAEGDALGVSAAVRLGQRREVSLVSGGTHTMLIRKGEQGEITLDVSVPGRVSAPVEKGEQLGEIRVMRGDEALAALPAVAGETVALPGMIGGLITIRDRFILGR